MTMIDRNEVLALIDGCEERALESADGSGGGRSGIEAAFRRLREALAAKAEPQGGEVCVETVGFVRENSDGDRFIDWALEGGIRALEIGCELVIADDKITDSEGGGVVYTHPAPKPAEGEGLKHVGWFSEVTPGNYCFIAGTTDPRDWHDNGKPYHHAMLAAAPKRGRE